MQSNLRITNYKIVETQDFASRRGQLENEIRIKKDFLRNLRDLREPFGCLIKDERRKAKDEIRKTKDERRNSKFERRKIKS